MSKRGFAIGILAVAAVGYLAGGSLRRVLTVGAGPLEPLDGVDAPAGFFLPVGDTFPREALVYIGQGDATPVGSLLADGIPTVVVVLSELCQMCGAEAVRWQELADSLRAQLGVVALLDSRGTAGIQEFRARTGVRYPMAMFDGSFLGRVGNHPPPLVFEVAPTGMITFSSGGLDATIEYVRYLWGSG